jgi:hypothetical protein
MIKNIELLYSVTLPLKNTFGYKVFTEENKEEIKVPTFFVSATPLTSDSYLRYNQKLTNIVITYVDRVIIQEELLDIQDKLDELFDMYLDVGKRKIVFDKKKFNITNDFLTMTLTLNYLDDKTSLPKSEQSSAKMGELNITEK